jgi:hypothetical protein
MKFNADSAVRSASLEVTVIRADGSVEHHGVVDYWDSNPLKRLLWRARRFVALFRGKK